MKCMWLERLVQSSHPSLAIMKDHMPKLDALDGKENVVSKQGPLHLSSTTTVF